MCHWVAGAQPKCIALPLFGHCLDLGCSQGLLHYHYLAVAQLPYAGRGSLPPPGGWGHIPVCCRTVIAYHYLAVAETQGRS